MAGRGRKQSEPPSDASEPSAGAAIAPADRPRAVVWFAPEQAALVEAVVATANLDVTGAGLAPAVSRMRRDPAREAAPADAASRDWLAQRRIDDLRSALLTSGADVALLAAGSAVESTLLEDAELCRAASHKGLRIISLAPFPGAARDGERHRDMLGALTGPPLFAPLFRRSPGHRVAADAINLFGPLTTLDLSFRSAAGQGALWARLFDAMDFVFALMGRAESVDAAIHGPRAETGLRLAPGESLRDLQGDLTAHLRYADGKSGAIALSDRAGRWFRGVTLLGESGCLRLEESGFEWLDGAGALVDSSGQKKRAASAKDAGDGGLAAAAGAIGEEILRAIEGRAGPESPPPLVEILAMCEAALLSARTGQPESPTTVLRMAGSI